MEPVPPYDDDNVVRESGRPASAGPPDGGDALSNFKSQSAEPLASPSSSSVSVVHQKIPAECFTEKFNCGQEGEGIKHMCCDYM